MLRHFILQLFLLIVCTYLHAQNNAVKEWAEQLENNPQHTEVISKIDQALSKDNLTSGDKLLLQIVLVHKLIALQKWDTCINYCQQQISIAQKNKDTPSEARFYMLLGNTYYNIIKKDKALEYWLKAIEIAEKNNIGEVLEHCTHNAGVYYLEINNTNLAEKYFVRSIELGKKNGTFFTKGGIRHMRLLATLYTGKKEYAKAENLYRLVIDSCRAASDSDNLKEALSFFSDALRKEKKYDQALVASQEAVRIDSLRKNQDITLTTLRFHAYNLYAAGNYKDAYLLMYRINDSSAKMYNLDIGTKISQAEAKFKNSEVRHEKEIELLKAKKEKQMYLMFFLGISFTLGTALYLYYRRKNAEQKLLMQQQVQIEKERLSRDLHDSLGSQMTLLSNNIETLDINYSRQRNIEENLGQVKDASRQLLQTLRGTIWVLNKEEISVQDFFDKLVDYCHRFLQSAHKMHMEVQESFHENKMLQNNEALQLFRICQEAITNAVKYSQGKKLIIAGAVKNRKLLLRISDDGIGFNTSIEPGEERFGLKNMRSRAIEINALISIKSVAEKGTTVEISL